MVNKVRSPSLVVLAGAMTLVTATAIAQTRQVTNHFVVTHGVGVPCGQTHRAIHQPAPGEHGAPGQPVTGAPYSGVGTTQIVQTLADGNRIVRTNTMRYFRDSEGRTRTEYELSAVGPFTVDGAGKVVMINDPVAKQRYVLHPDQKLAAAMPIAVMPVEGAAGIISSEGVSEHATPMMPMPGCTSSSHSLQAEPMPLGERTIDGLRVVGSRVEFEIAAGAIGNEQPITVRSEQWFSPELGVVIESVHQDPMMGEIRYRLEQISRAEPDPSLFKPPSDYTRQEAPKAVESRLQRRMRDLPPTPAFGPGGVVILPERRR
ncbi:MAG TPA: hypothetical protein VIL32_18130 [Steroidobacteraceae bacterium]